MKKYVGIVLKSYVPRMRKFAVLCKQEGKIVCIPDRTDVSCGSLVYFFAYQQGQLFFMHNIEVIDVPLFLAREDILFFHHVLEICYYFIPAASHNKEVFSLLVYIYNGEKNVYTNLSKKIFLFKLFVMLGIYPDDSKSRSSILYKLAPLSIDILLSQSLDLTVQQALDEWLLSCVSVHPYVNNFKTIHFLTKCRIV